jgi:ketosteroid isomerase-like protein
MKSNTLCRLLAALLLGLVSVTRAATADDAIAAVLIADKARGTAMLAADMKALGSILADDLNYTHSNDRQETKATHLDSYAQGLRYTRFETSALRAKVITPDVVTLNGIIDQTKGKEGAWKDYHLLFLAVWRKTATGAWQLTSLQTAVPPAPAAK